MTKSLIFILFFFSTSIILAQESPGNFLKDPKTGCTVWYKHMFIEDSVTWNGGCKDGFAEGSGTMVGFTRGIESSTYVGEMKQGKPHGKGVFEFGAGRKLEGNFLNGEPLFLKPEQIKQLNKHVISETDPQDFYVGDNGITQLYYQALVPAGKLKGAIVLMPGTWETTEHMLSSTQQLCELAQSNQLAVLALSINQRLTLTDTIVKLMNQMFIDAMNRYKIPKDKFVIGGFSMGGLFSLRYTEKAMLDSGKTAIVPAAVFSCDGPCDLANLYANFQIKQEKFPGPTESRYGMLELERFCGGTPDSVPEKYVYYSCFSQDRNDGGNAKFLIKTPVRIYADVDPNWWLANRKADMYDLNALDQTAMILFLQEKGNTKAEFINAFGKGYRIEGSRHPHSWSIIDAKEAVEWVMTCIQ